jgi:hypothetical protein
MSGEHVRYRCQHPHKVGGRRGWYGGYAGASSKARLIAPQLPVAECANNAFVTADERFLRELHRGRQRMPRPKALSLIEAAKL